MKKQIPTFLILSLSAILPGCHRSPSHDQQVVRQSYVHRYGMEIGKEDWENRGQSGQIVNTLKNGVTQTEPYQNGRKHGDVTYTYPHTSTVQRIETYQQGQLVREVENYPSGAIQSEIRHSPNGMTQVTLWYETGNMRSQESYRDEYLEQGEYLRTDNSLESQVIKGQGQRMNRDEFGQLLSMDDIQDGKLVLKTTYFPNGAVKETTPYRNGLIAGTKRTFNPGGDPVSVEEWQENRQEGTTLLFQNGEKMAEIPYINGLKQGVEKRFRDGQFMVEEISWSEGRRHGPSSIYHGDSVQVDWYFEGKVFSKSQYEKMTGARLR